MLFRRHATSAVSILFKRGSRKELDGMSPRDVVYASSGRLSRFDDRKELIDLILDDQINSESKANLSLLCQSRSEKFDELIDHLMVECELISRSPSVARAAVIHQRVSKVTDSIVRFSNTIPNDASSPYEDLILVAVFDGASRLLELGRRPQSTDVLKYGIQLFLYLHGRSRGADPLQD